MPRWRIVVAAILGWLFLGFALPLSTALWLLFHYEPPFVVDTTRLATPSTAFAGHPAITPVTGVLAAGRGATAVYPDTSTVTIVRTAAPEPIVESYAAALHPASSTSTSIQDFTQRDLRLGGGRVARIIRIGDTVFAFLAPDARTLDRLVAATPSLKRNSRRAVGNVVYDDHGAAAIAVGLVWGLGSFLLATVLIMRYAKPGPTLPPPGTIAVAPDELARRLLALGDGTHPFVVTAGSQPGEFLVDWRYDAQFNAFVAAYGERKLFRIRLRLDPAGHTVDSTDFQSGRTVSAGVSPDAFATIGWTWSRGYVLADREIGWVNGKPYRFDIREMRAPVVATVAQAGWIYRPRL